MRKLLSKLIEENFFDQSFLVLVVTVISVILIFVNLGTFIGLWLVIILAVLGNLIGDILKVKVQEFKTIEESQE